MSYIPLPTRVSDAIHLLLECVPAGDQDPVRREVTAEAEAVTARFREACGGVTPMTPRVDAYSHLNPMVQALTKLRGCFALTELAQQNRGMQAMITSSRVLDECRQSADHRVSLVLGSVLFHMAHAHPGLAREQARWLALGNEVHVAAEVLKRVRRLLVEALEQNSLPAKAAEAWRQLAPQVEDVLAHDACEDRSVPYYLVAENRIEHVGSREECFQRSEQYKDCSILPQSQWNLDLDKVRDLHEAGFYVGVRDPDRNRAFIGRFMVCEHLSCGPTDDASSGGFCIVGDDMRALVEDAHEHLLAMRDKEVHSAGF